MTDVTREGTRTLTVERSTSTAHRLTQYDGVCGNIHGHNMVWQAEVDLSMDEVGDDNMPVDLKDISEEIDQLDHVMVLSTDDPLTDIDRDPETALGTEVIWFDSDPTCEHLSKWMAQQIYEIDDAIFNVKVTVSETEKYGISAVYDKSDAEEEEEE